MEAADKSFCDGLSALVAARELETCEARYISCELRDDAIIRYRGRWNALVATMADDELPAR